MSFGINQAPLMILLDDRVAGSGLAAGETVTQSVHLGGRHNGRVQGNFASDQPAASVVVTQYPEAGSAVPGVTWNIPLDPDQPNYRYDFSIIIVQPYVTVTYVNGATPSTYFRASVVALPLY